MEQITDQFMCSFVLDDYQKTEVVDVETISCALCVFKNYGGPLQSYFCVLPKRKWGHFLSENITLDPKWTLMHYITKKFMTKFKLT
jgi:hypothetical protein